MTPMQTRRSILLLQSGHNRPPPRTRNADGEHPRATQLLDNSQHHGATLRHVLWLFIIISSSSSSSSSFDDDDDDDDTENTTVRTLHWPDWGPAAARVFFSPRGADCRNQLALFGSRASRRW